MLSHQPGNTIVHRSDPRVKIIWLLALVLISFSARTVPNAALSIAMAALLLSLSGLSFRQLFPSFKFIGFVIAASFAIGWLFGSISYGLANAMILISAITLSLLFIVTTGRDSIVAAIRFFGVPKHTAFSLALALYFLPVFERNFLSVRIAQAARAHSSKNPIPLVVPFMHSVLGKAKGLSLSLDARGFDPEKADIPYRLKMKSSDWLSLSCLVLVIAIRLCLSGWCNQYALNS